MSQDELNRLRTLCELASPAPWEAVRDHLGHWRVTWSHSQNSSVLRNGKLFSDDDVAFIVAARLALPRLIEEVERMQSLITAREGT